MSENDSTSRLSFFRSHAALRAKHHRFVPMILEIGQQPRKSALPKPQSGQDLCVP